MGEHEDDLVAELSRWETSGGHWRILEESDGWLTVGLFTCDGGEEMGRASGARTDPLTTFLAGRTQSED